MSLEPIQKLNKDLKNATVTLSKDEARFLVDSYYQMQEKRKRADNQIRSMDKNGESEPHEVLSWLAANNRSLENQIKSALGAYAMSKELGKWAMNQLGIGPVITAGLLAHIDVTVPTVGHIWSFAGLVPGVKWEKGQRRPWNAALKTLCWKIGESFKKVSGKEDAFYGGIYAERKVLETGRNLHGKYKEQAMERAKSIKAAPTCYWYQGRYKASDILKLVAAEIPPIAWETELKKGNKLLDKDSKEGNPMLSPGHITQRAQRYAMKLFLSHYHDVGYRIETGNEPPNPYPIQHLGHVHKIEVPA